MQWWQNGWYLFEQDSMSMISEIIDSDNQNRFCSENSESIESLCTSLAALSTASKGQGMWRDRYTIYPLHYLPFPAESDEQVLLAFNSFNFNTQDASDDKSINNTCKKKQKFYLLFRINSPVTAIWPKRNERVSSMLLIRERIVLPTNS